MQPDEIHKLKEEIAPEIETGDYITLGKILVVAQGTARMRFHRENEEAVLAMKKIIDAREKLIDECKIPLETNQDNQ